MFDLHTNTLRQLSLSQYEEIDLIGVEALNAGWLVHFTVTRHAEDTFNGQSTITRRVAFFGADEKCRWNMIAE